MDQAKSIQAGLDASVVINFFGENEFFLAYQRIKGIT